ncbi:type II toxin-antitoxin system prevent-host-death family antitoxin [bacterium CPR1]|nr:type II toxin-antitoxin system prevent-host-death family antitoxin [bacterium CPR1]
MERVTTHEAKTNLSQLLSRVLEGEEILICRGAVPVARLVPVDRRECVSRSTTRIPRSGSAIAASGRSA